MTVQSAAARFRGDGRIEFETRTLAPPADGDVRLRVEVCALCGSDKRLLAAGSDVVPGHEIAGTVVDPGKNPDLAAGQRGIVYIPVYCGHCPGCTAGQTNRCRDIAGLVGWQRDGGFAEHVDVPARCVIPVPDDIPLDVAVLGLDTIGTAGHALRLALRTQVDPPARMLVVGCGPLGLGVTALAPLFGLGNVDVTDPHPGRLAIGVELGGTAASDLESLNQYDLVVEVSGTRAGRTTAQNVVVPGGAVVVLGESNEPYEMPATPRWRRTDCFTVRACCFPLSDVADNWDLLRACGPLLRDALVTPLTLDRLPEAFDRFVAGDMFKPAITATEET